MVGLVQTQLLLNDMSKTLLQLDPEFSRLAESPSELHIESM